MALSLHPHFSWEPGFCLCPFHTPWMELQPVCKKEKKGDVLLWWIWLHHGYWKRCSCCPTVSWTGFVPGQSWFMWYFVCRMSKVIQSVWHWVLKGSESTAERETHLWKLTRAALGVLFMQVCTEIWFNFTMQRKYFMLCDVAEVCCRWCLGVKSLKRWVGKKQMTVVPKLYEGHVLLFLLANSCVASQFLKLWSQTVNDPLRDKRWQKLYTNKYPENSLQSLIHLGFQLFFPIKHETCSEKNSLC